MFWKVSRSQIKRQVPENEAEAIGYNLKLADRDPRVAGLSLNPREAFYLDDWAVSAYEKFGLNENWDGFQKVELKKSYPTFIGAWVCLDHDNDHAIKAVGENIDSVYMPEDYVRVVMAVNRRKSEAKHPGLEQKINSGQITDTSMGCWASHSICTVCSNVAFDEDQLCKHAISPHDPDRRGGQRGMRVKNAQTSFKEIIAGELNCGVMFFENSIITSEEGADPNAKLLAKLAKQRKSAHSIDANVLYRTLREMSKTASVEEKVFLARLTENLAQNVLDYKG